MPKSLILCDCAGTQQVDRAALESACGVSCSRVFTALCDGQIDRAAEAMQHGDVVIACGQEQARFTALAEDIGAEAPGFVDLRDRAGWSDQGADAAPKMAALVAEALLPVPSVRSLDVPSHGVCLIVGPGEGACALAGQLSEALTVTVLMTDGAAAPVSRDYDVVRGRLKHVQGALGGFRVTIDALEQMVPAGRGEFSFSSPQDGAQSECDILIDVAGDVSFVPAPQKREGYLRADPRDPLAVMRLAVQAVQLVGTFEKPLYLHVEEHLCAHSRAEQVGCSNCIDICPTGAISPAGDHVAVDPMVCAGCGACAALCPSTAIRYDVPEFDVLLKRIQTLATVFSSSGGTSGHLLVHDDAGAELIRMAARFGRGLPAHVIPFHIGSVQVFGHAEMLAALAQGMARVTVLRGPRTEADALDREVALANAIAGREAANVLVTEDPDQMSDALYGFVIKSETRTPIVTLGNRRQVTRMAARALNPGRETPIDLPQGAPYGAVLVDTDACTLCLSCVSLCPSGALLDNPDMPQLRFQEDACLQCGICATICPEQAITLEPRLDPRPHALEQKVLHEEEPFACVECGALFGVKSTIEKITEKLAGAHPMFATSDKARMIQMCDNCRVNAQFHSADNPFQGKPRPRVRTTDDYLSKRRDH